MRSTAGVNGGEVFHLLKDQTASDLSVQVPILVVSGWSLQLFAAS